MIAMKSHLYTIRVVTNLHVGSGNANSGIIDNLIQKDVITGRPVINSSGFKGALREHCKNWKQQDITAIFGSGPDAESMQQGSCRFFDCRLLAMPVRTDKEPYMLATCASVLNEFLEYVSLFSISGWNHFHKFQNKHVAEVHSADNGWWKGGGLLVEDLSYASVACVQYDLINLLFGPDRKVLLVPDEDFSRLSDDFHLPVMARNCLETEKENLWYEQVLPRESVLYTIIQAPDEEDCMFVQGCEDMLVQIGANASIGYGFCKITRR